MVQQLQKNNYTIIYNCSNKTFASNDVSIAADDFERFNSMISDICSAKEPGSWHTEVNVIIDGTLVLCNAFIFISEPFEQAVISFIKSDEGNTNDHLTGLLDRNGFSQRIAECLQNDIIHEGERAFIMFFDVQRMKAINELFGFEEGDKLLIHIADTIRNSINGYGAVCRFNANSDKFVLMTKCCENKITSFVENVLNQIADFDVPFEIICNAGIYIIDDISLPPEKLIDRAMMAQMPIKGSYTARYNYYSDTLREKLLSDHEITGMMRSAIKKKQFIIHYQPQYNHSTGMLVGAEALVRWQHPEKGIIPPSVFIPVFEKNGFITQLDLYVFEQVCIFLRYCIDSNYHLVPISTNLTRYDIFAPNFIEKLEETRIKYDIPPSLLRIEITESAALGNSQFINDAVKRLHNFGYVVEMDDFGSGYSSLNILKDIDFDIIKLDMRFLQKEENSSNRGGTILSSIVRMINWLGLPIIAEGVETIGQADFLGSISCDYIQGYLYSKPLPQTEFESLLSASQIGKTLPRLKLLDTLDPAAFWSNDSLETLIFSNFVGGAAIFEYKDGKIEVLRVNKKYLSELGMNLSEKELINTDPFDYMEMAEIETYKNALAAAIETEDEQECETWRTILSSCCGEERLCIRSSIRLIGKIKKNYLFYAMIRNITPEKEKIDKILKNEKCFKIASEQANIYFWEYNILNKEMRPCFRCMRDLGLPPLLTNYPDSAIEMGVFPPEVADMYRDWHRQLAEGVPSLEAVIPLTADRIPHYVKYTTEFDEHGRPIKAYGSATFIQSDI